MGSNTKWEQAQEMYRWDEPTPENFYMDRQRDDGLDAYRKLARNVLLRAGEDAQSRWNVKERTRARQWLTSRDPTLLLWCQLAAIDPTQLEATVHRLESANQSSPLPLTAVASSPSPI